jgi:hypothetical protein
MVAFAGLTDKLPDISSPYGKFATCDGSRGRGVTLLLTRLAHDSGIALHKAHRNRLLFLALLEPNG